MNVAITTSSKREVHVASSVVFKKKNPIQTCTYRPLFCLFFIWITVNLSIVSQKITFSEYVADPTGFRIIDENSAFFKHFSGIDDALNHSFSRKDKSTLRRHSFWIKDRSSRRQAVIVTAANAQVFNMTRNLRCFVKQSTKKEVVVFSLDEDMTKISKKYHIPSVPCYEFKDENLNISDNSGIGKIANFGSKRFSGLSNSKLWIVYQVLRLGYDIILSDVDTIWCKNMISVFESYMSNYSDMDMFIQSNSWTLKNGGQANTGFYYVKCTKTMVQMFESLTNGLKTVIEKGSDDQSYFWRHSCRWGGHPVKGTGGRMQNFSNGHTLMVCQWSPDQGESITKMLLLPLTEFPNGASDSHGRPLRKVPSGFYREECKTKNITMWHTNFIGGTLKENFMRAQNVWILRDDGNCNIV